MRLLAALMAVFVVMTALAPSTIADGTESSDDSSDGCRIDLADPTKPAIYGDCIIWGSGTGVGGTTSTSDPGAAADVTLVTPATVACDALCDRMIQVSLSVQTQGGDNVAVDSGDGIHAPLGAYVEANLETPQGGVEAGTDEGGLFASTLSTPFELG